MNWTIDKLSSPGVLRVKLSGDCNPDQFGILLEELFSEKDNHPDYPVLFDDRELVFSEVAAHDMLPVRDMFVNTPGFARRKVALLMNSISDFLVANEFKAIMQPAVDAVFDVFHDEGTALAWLSGPVGCPPHQTSQAVGL